MILIEHTFSWMMGKHGGQWVPTKAFSKVPDPPSIQQAQRMETFYISNSLETFYKTLCFLFSAVVCCLACWCRHNQGMQSGGWMWGKLQRTAELEDSEAQHGFWACLSAFMLLKIFEADCILKKKMCYIFKTLYIIGWVWFPNKVATHDIT